MPAARALIAQLSQPLAPAAADTVQQRVNTITVKSADFTACPLFQYLNFNETYGGGYSNTAPDVNKFLI